MMNDLSQRIDNLSAEKRARLTRRLRDKRAETAAKHSLRRRDDQSHYPLSFAQERLWFLDQFAHQSPFYNIPAALRLTGPLDLPALRQSLNEITRRHEVLRATFTNDKGQPRQFIAPGLVLQLPVTDLQALPKNERQDRLMQLALEEAQRPFDLAKGPLVRANIIKADTDVHVLLLTLHHIVFDGWSTEVLFRELSAFYDAFCSQRPPTVPDLSIQYADYAVWQRGHLQDKELETHIDYWKQRLDGKPTLLELPIDQPRPPVQSYRGAHHTFFLSQRLHEQLKVLSQREEATLFMTLLAAFQVLLSRYSGQTDICVGTPVANRTQLETEQLIGFFVNTLVIRSDLSGGLTFHKLLKRVREMALGAYAHQDLPIEKLVEVMHSQRDLSYSPLFQVMFDLQAAPFEKPRLGSLRLDLMEFETGISKFDLALILAEDAAGLKGTFEFCTDLFSAATVQKMAVHYQRLLEAIVLDENWPIEEVPLLMEAERRHIVVECNATEADYPRGLCVHQLFQEQARRSPQAPAVRWVGGQLSYEQLNWRANQLAHFLKGIGVGPEVLVGLCLERSVEMVVGVLGVLKAGGAYVPLDPDYPAERIAYMIEDSGLSVLLIQERLSGLLLGESTRVVKLDDNWSVVAGFSLEDPGSLVVPENLAYVIYTSGSTGRPKGTEVEHGSLLNLVFWHQHAFNLSPSDRSPLIASFGFDASVWELWPCLAAGASIHIPDANVRALPEDLMNWLVSNDITVGFIPTPLTESLMALKWPPSSKLRILLTGGDRLQHYPYGFVPFELFNNYGPTENTVVTTSARLIAPEQGRAAPSIGRPIANNHVYVLDGHLNPVPIGVTGELYIGGFSLARSYLRRPELTAEKFVPDPFSGKPGARLYKTGDLVRLRCDGAMDFLGREDQQVKIRGFRIELGEIENVLIEHPDVQQCAVSAWNDSLGAPRLVAHIAMRNGMEFSETGLREFLNKKLPNYMLPATFVALDSLPLTPSGKVDRRALPAPDQERPHLAEMYVAPRNRLEQALSEIWADVLRVKAVGVFDNFFGLGGHSLLATQVVSRVREEFKVELPLKDFFQGPTVAALAERVEATLWALNGLNGAELGEGRSALERGEL